MTTFTFKSVGTTQADKAAQQLIKSPTPIGIKTPLRFGTSEIFDVTYSLADQVHYNLRDMLLTNWGERLGNYSFGANLTPLVSELVSQEDFDNAAVERISGAIQRWMPYVVPVNYKADTDHVENKNTAVIRITLTYSVPALGITNKALQITLYAI